MWLRLWQFPLFRQLSFVYNPSTSREPWISLFQLHGSNVLHTTERFCSYVFRDFKSYIQTISSYACATCIQHNRNFTLHVCNVETALTKVNNLNCHEKDCIFVLLLTTFLFTQNLTGLDFDLSRSLNIKCNSAVEFSTYDFLLVLAETYGLIHLLRDIR